jgi:hypothetical protein
MVFMQGGPVEHVDSRPAGADMDIMPFVANQLAASPSISYVAVTEK